MGKYSKRDLSEYDFSAQFSFPRMLMMEKKILHKWSKCISTTFLFNEWKKVVL